MSVLPQPILDLIESFASLPGIGPKSASRLVFHLLKREPQELAVFGERITSLKSKLRTCQQCQNIALQTPCSICSDPGRDQNILCVVEDTLDVVALEKSGQFRGLYHVLHGVLSPIEGIGPDQLKIKELEQRMKQPIKEVIIATNPTVEGEATALYISRRIKALSGATISRLAHGLPVGADLEYADEITLGRALSGRQSIEPTVKN
jgi:recombination protein RecR